MIKRWEKKDTETIHRKIDKIATTMKNVQNTNPKITTEKQRR